jgi:hypothetical protein
MAEMSDCLRRKPDLPNQEETKQGINYLFVPDEKEA